MIRGGRVNFAQEWFLEAPMPSKEARPYMGLGSQKHFSVGRGARGKCASTEFWKAPMPIRYYLWLGGNRRFCIRHLDGMNFAYWRVFKAPMPIRSYMGLGMQRRFFVQLATRCACLVACVQDWTNSWTNDRKHVICIVFPYLGHTCGCTFTCICIPVCLGTCTCLPASHTCTWICL